MGLPIILGLWARYKPVPYWESHKAHFYVEGRPIFTAYDSYYLARLAEDYKRGVFIPGGEDKLRFVPDYTNYPAVIPFYSWLFAKLSVLFNKPIENLSFWLVPLLAVLFVIPLVLLLYFGADAPLAAIGGGVVGALALIYLVRTSLNRLDTDSIVMFSFFAIPLAVYFAVEKAKSKREKYLFLLLLALFSNLFYWGYLHAGLNLVLWLVSVLLLLLPLFKKWVKTKRFDIKELLDKQLLLDIGLLTLAFNPVILLFGIFNLIKKASAYIFNFGKPIEGGFPNVQISISELQHLGPDALAKMTVGSEWLLFLGFFGLALFAWRRFKVFLLLLPMLLIGLLAFKGASRFAMFLAPLLGIGIGFILDLLWGYLKERFGWSGWKEALPLSVLALLLAVVLAYANRYSFQFIPRPIMNSAIAEAFIELGRQTPSNAWIYTWWDYGFAIQYYARRATFHDGGSQCSPKTYFMALGFTATSQEVGYNVTKSLTVCGAKCIEKLLKEGKTAEEIKELFVKGELLKKMVKKELHPVYWAFTEDLIGKFYWISYFGTWDFKTEKGEHHPIYPAVCKEKRENLYLCNISGMLALLDKKDLKLLVGKNRFIPLKVFALRTPQKLEIKENKKYPFGNAMEEVYTYRPNFYIWYYTDLRAFESNFNRMYPLRVWDNKYFEKVKERFPDYTFYLVR